MILWTVLGLLLGAAVMMAFIAIADNSYRYEKQWYVVGLITSVLVFIIATYTGCVSDIVYYNKEVNKFIVTKQTIEQSLSNGQIGGFERLDLVKQAIEENKNLESLKIDAKQWWYFYLDESKIKDLEPISFK